MGHPAKIRTVIVDDERLARQRIRRMLAAEPDVEIAGEFEGSVVALEFLARHAVELMFLDIRMPEMDGFTMLEQLVTARAPIVVFVTAFDQYAVRAFDVNAFDYLLKPFDRQRFQKTIERVRSQLSRPTTGDANQRLLALIADLRMRRDDGQRFAIKTAGRIVFVRTEDIDWIEAADNYVCLHAGAEKHLLRETMNSVEARLDPVRFARIHRSTIVNVDRIKEMHPWFRGDHIVLLQNGTKLTLSRTYRDRLSALLHL